MAEAILTSWRFDPRVICLLAAAAWLYIRGWRRLHRQSPQRYTPERLVAYLGGLTALFAALASPLDAFGSLLLEAHMVQHLLLIVVAPPLILLGQPILPILRGLPPRVFRDGLGPFLSWHWLQKAGRRLTHPVVCWLAMAAVLVFWHMPRWYDLGLSSPAWHGVEHACFFYAAILFWWPVIQVWPSRPQWPRWAMIPYLVLADIVNTALSAWLVFSTHVVYRTYELAPRLGDMSALDDQSTAGAIMWVPGSIAFLIPALVLTMQAVSNTRTRPQFVRIKPMARPADRQRWDLFRVPALGPILRYRHTRRLLQLGMFALAAAVVIDGFLGPQIAPLNLAGVLPWTYWRGFAVIVLIAGGNFFCMACPFMLARDVVRNVSQRLLPGRYRWPKPLRSKWLAIGLLALYLWANEAFSLWNSPWWTAWVVAGYFIAALLINGLFHGASFCKYVCPIGQFNFANSLVSPLEVGVRSSKVCASCRTEDCIRGNETQRGCELYLFQPMKTGNFDCTFCLDCVNACPRDNIGILANVPGHALLQDRRSSGIGRLSQRPDAAALVWVMAFGALVSAAVMVDPVMRWMHSIRTALGLQSMLPVTTGFFVAGTVVAPLFLAWVCGSTADLFSQPGLSQPGVRWKPMARRFGLALIPLGFSMWTAHFSFHFFTAWRSIIPVVERILRLSAPAIGLSAQVPAWLPAAQILLLDGGLVLSVYIAWRTALRQTGEMSRALALVAPWTVLAIGIYAASVWILFQPMQMRGMVM